MLYTSYREFNSLQNQNLVKKTYENLFLDFVYFKTHKNLKKSHLF